jgi:adenylate cyclase, class 2
MIFYRMLEIEMKFPVRDFAAVESRLSEWQAEGPEILDEADHYFNAPDRDFAQTDEALRLRRVASANFLTYKGPKIDARTKTRAEIEVRLSDGDDTAKKTIQFFTSLGYRPVAVVKKRRQVYRTQRDGFSLEICLDEVEGSGKFVELEILAPEDRLDAGRDALLQLAGELGLTNTERRSYLEMLLARGT